MLFCGVLPACQGGVTLPGGVGAGSGLGHGRGVLGGIGSSDFRRGTPFHSLLRFRFAIFLSPPGGLSHSRFVGQPFRVVRTSRIRRDFDYSNYLLLGK